MSQTQSLISTLKRELRAQGLTYAHVAKHLKLSENSIKRLFSEQKLSLLRLEQICDLLGLGLTDLIQKMSSNSSRIEMLTKEQEREIANDPKLLLAAICVLNRWSYEEIIHEYKISATECIQLLAKLDKLNIIELLPLNRFRLIVANNFRWQANGAVQRFFEREVQPDFFRSSFSNAGEKRLFTSGMLSRNANATMMKKMDKLIAEFNELHADDSSLPLEERFGTSIMLALRAWEFNLFQQLRRDTTSKPF